MNRVAVVLALLAGVALGLVLGRVRAPAPDAAVAPPAARAAAAPSPEALTAELREVRRQLDDLRRQKALDPSGGPYPGRAGPPPPARERAESIFETFRRAFVDKEGPELLKALGSVDELDESMAAFFVERHRAGIENAELRNMNLLLIHLSGGPQAASFVVDFLRDPAVPAAERNSLLHNLSGTGLPELRKLPYEGALAATTETLLASKVPAERMGGAGLLGGSPDDGARVRLLRLAESDPDAGVRSSALASLGWTGDRATYERLKSWKAEGGEKSALERALAQLKRRFPD
jgi:hypothetical protein